MVIDNHLRQGKISCLLVSDLSRMFGAKPEPGGKCASSHSEK